MASSDEQLVDLVLGGDDEAFEVLFDRHVADAVWFARDMLGSWGEAEEAVRHSFAAAHAYLASRDREIEFAPWLHTILGNHCLSMLQARGPQPGDVASVVDLDQWRRQRKRLGVAVPVVPSAGLHDSVMTACGIGTGAAAAGAPLLGGTLAKLAVVALLAGGAGVTGHTIAERDPAAGSAEVERSAHVAATTDWADKHPPAISEPVRSSKRFRVSQPRRVHAGAEVRSTPQGSKPQVEVPSTDSPTRDAPPSALAPSAGEGQTGETPASPSLPNTVGGASEPAVSPLRTTLRRAGEVVNPPATPPTGAPPQVPLPLPVDVPKIGDDLQVTTGKLTADVRALLSHGATVPPP